MLSELYQQISQELLDLYGIEVSLFVDNNRPDGKIGYKGDFYLDDVLLFEDFSVGLSPLTNPDLEYETGLLLVLYGCAMRKGDTDPDWFDQYTPEQHAWADSWKCEDLQCFVAEWEEKVKSYE